MLKGRGKLERPFAGSHFRVWKLPNRRIYTNANHDWRMGIWQGPQATGASINWERSVISTPAAIRRTSVREALASLHAQGQVRFPASTNANAQQGLSRMGNRTATVAMNVCEAGEFAPIRLAGPTARAH